MNFPYLLDVQATHAAWIIAAGAGARRHPARGRPPTPKRPGSTPLWHGRRRSAERAKACTPGYYNREGQANAKTRQGSFFYGSPTEYADILAAWRANGALEGFEIFVRWPRCVALSARAAAGG